MYSKIEKITLDGFSFFLKRDDMLGLINGNKARKLYYYMKNKACFKPQTRFISYGSAQSNALLALSYFTLQNDFKLLFVTPKLSSFLKQNPHGNFKTALDNQALIIENESQLSLRQKALSLCQKDDIFIPEGVACKEACFGFEKLAQEIKEQGKELQCDFDIFLSSGTGTSAAFLAQYLACKVFTCACVGDERYLKEQILELEPKFDFSNLHILHTDTKFHFAKPHKELLDIYHKALKQCGVEFDLIYDSVGLLCVLKHKTLFNKPLLFIHQGGISANESMLRRYAYKGLESKDATL